MSGILSFCESVAAGSGSRWHLRWLDRAGPKPTGGITTDALCGHPRAPHGWDVEVALTEHHLQHNTCRGCLAVLAARDSRPLKPLPPPPPGATPKCPGCGVALTWNGWSSVYECWSGKHLDEANGARAYRRGRNGRLAPASREASPTARQRARDMKEVSP